MKERILWIDMLKGFLILLVILGHVIQIVEGRNTENVRLWNIIYSFHLPVFVAVSGYTFTYNNKISFWEKVERRFRQLIVPFLIWSVIQYCLYIINGVDRPYGIVGILFIPDHYFWFLWVLFWVYVLMLLSYKIGERIIISSNVVSALFCIFLIAIMLLFDIHSLGIQYITYYYIFYYLGTLVNKIGKKLYSSKWTIILSLGLWFLGAWFWRMHTQPEWLTVFMSSQTLASIYLYRGITALFAVYGFIGISSMVSSINIRSFCLTQFGSLSLGVYVFHLIIIRSYIDYYTEAIGIKDHILIVIISFVTLSAISYIVVKLLSMNDVTRTYLLGKI